MPDSIDWVWRSDTVTLATQAIHGSQENLSTAVILDDRPQSVGVVHKDAWRRWLRISNLLNLRTRPTVISPWTRVHSAPTLD